MTCQTLQFPTLLRQALFALLFLLVGPRLPAATPVLTAEVRGSGPPMIFLPGMACSGDVWSEFAAPYASKHQVHLLSFAGFCGRPPVEGRLYNDAVRDLEAYIQENKLDRPILVGHDLGGVVALTLAADMPDLPGAVIAVGAAPCRAALWDENYRPDMARMRANHAADEPTNRTPHGLRAFLLNYFYFSVLDRSRAEALLEAGDQSDPATVLEVWRDLETLDLRPRLHEITAPVLLVGSGVRFGTARTEPEYAWGRHAEQLLGAPNITLTLAETSRHFIMFDSPAFLREQIDIFLANHPSLPH